MGPRKKKTNDDKFKNNNKYHQLRMQGTEIHTFGAQTGKAQSFLDRSQDFGTITRIMLENIKQQSGSLGGSKSQIYIQNLKISSKTHS